MRNVRPALSADAPIVLEMLTSLATIETDAAEVTASAADLAAALRSGALYGFLATDDGEPIGMLLWQKAFTTWAGAPAVHVLDLFVSPDVRGEGVAAELFSAVQHAASALGAARLDWWVREDNATAQRFYSKLGAGVAQGWQSWRLPLEG